MLTRIDRPWTNVYGLARSMLALATLVTLLGDSSEQLFAPLTIPDVGTIDRSAVSGLSLFFLLREHLWAAKLLAVVILLVVISGWRPRWTGLLHWWVAFSFAASASLIDGGDLIASILSLLLIPVTLTDRRQWHWEGIGTAGKTATVLAETGLLLIRIQVAVIYFFAAVLKFPTAEWANGTALYYVWSSAAFGPAPALRPLISLLGRTILVVPLTWSVLVLELLLAGALVASLRYRARLLPVAVLFHVGIAVLHGLPTFALTMSAALVLYLRPTWRPFALPELRRRAVPRAPEQLHTSPLAH